MKSAAKAGRKNLGLGPIFSVQLTLEQHAWVDAHIASDETRSRVIRGLVKAAMESAKTKKSPD